MNNQKVRYLLFAVTIVCIIIFAGGYQLPMYATRLTALAALAIADMLCWLNIRKLIAQRFLTWVKISYWLPLVFLLLFFICGLITPYTLWPALFKVYIPGILMILLIGKGIFLSLFILGNFIKIFFLNVRKLFSGYPNKPKSKRKPGFILLFASGISVVVMLVYFSGMIFWVNNFKLQTVEIKLKGLPHEFDGYKIIQLSDLHLGTYVSKHPLDKIVRMVNAEHPDLILFTGDLINFTTKEALPFETSMKLFSSKDGIFSILGNHDYGEYSKWESKFEKEMNDKALFAFYERIGWHLLRNQNFIINRDSAAIAIVGVENWSLTKRFGKKGDIKKAIRGCEQVQTKILLSHDPSHWDGEINWLYPDICLTLSGHTHAFQFAIETGNYKWSPASILFAQWGGLYEKLHQNGLKQYLYVNRGVGTLGYPGRIATRPEITLIILRSE